MWVVGHDVVFHHRPALTTREKAGVGIGTERGWDAYQWPAWNAAYGSARAAIPLLYARSSTEPAGDVFLRSFDLDLRFRRGCGTSAGSRCARSEFPAAAGPVHQTGLG